MTDPRSGSSKIILPLPNPLSLHFLSLLLPLLFYIFILFNDCYLLITVSQRLQEVLLIGRAGPGCEEGDIALDSLFVNPLSLPDQLEVFIFVSPSPRSRSFFTSKERNSTRIITSWLWFKSNSECAGKSSRTLHLSLLDEPVDASNTEEVFYFHPLSLSLSPSLLSSITELIPTGLQTEAHYGSSHPPPLPLSSLLPPSLLPTIHSLAN